MPKSDQKISVPYIVNNWWLIISLAVSAWYLFHGSQFVQVTDSLRSTITSMFSILTGIILAIMIAFGNKSEHSVKPYSRKEVFDIIGTINRQKLMLNAYLATLFLIFIFELVSLQLPLFANWIEKAFVSTAIFGFLQSFSFSIHLSRSQLRRFEEKDGENIKNEIANIEDDDPFGDH
uniref:Uncharacterized protein n=1 Tax=OCS116 cluster bacterium TaxID=2030921 RepID=A0A2A4YUB3_9PROT